MVKRKKKIICITKEKEIKLFKAYSIGCSIRSFSGE
jgi:hypothetical protein